MWWLYDQPFGTDLAPKNKKNKEPSYARKHCKT